MRYCRTCRASLALRQAKVTSSKLKKQYYYKAYYLCPICKKVYLDEKFKVTNKQIDFFVQRPGITPDPDVEIWTDGACVNNGTDSARAAWAFVTEDYQDAGLVQGKKTNNTAEAYAIYHALLWAMEQGYKHIVVHSDSQITIGNLRKPWEKIRENQEIFRLIQELIERNNLHVLYKKVRGHAGDPNNEKADHLATTLASS